MLTHSSYKATELHPFFLRLASPGRQQLVLVLPAACSRSAHVWVVVIGCLLTNSSYPVFIFTSLSSVLQTCRLSPKLSLAASQRQASGRSPRRVLGRARSGASACFCPAKNKASCQTN